MNPQWRGPSEIRFSWRHLSWGVGRWRRRVNGDITWSWESFIPMSDVPIRVLISRTCWTTGTVLALVAIGSVVFSTAFQELFALLATVAKWFLGNVS